MKSFATVVHSFARPSPPLSPCPAMFLADGATPAAGDANPAAGGANPAVTFSNPIAGDANPAVTCPPPTATLPPPMVTCSPPAATSPPPTVTCSPPAAGFAPIFVQNGPFSQKSRLLTARNAVPSTLWDTLTNWHGQLPRPGAPIT